MKCEPKSPEEMVAGFNEGSSSSVPKVYHSNDTHLKSTIRSPKFLIPNS